MRITILGLIVAICVCNISSSATTYYVALSGIDDNYGTNGWEDALLTISNAVRLAGNDDTILVSNGTYYLSAAISVTKALDIRGFSGNPADTIINGNYPVVTNRCFDINHTGAVISAFTITNGCMHGGGGGGGVRLNAGIVSNCVISGNRSYTTNTVGMQSGGGVNSTITTYGALLNSVISGNVSSNNDGGMALYVPSGYFLVSNCQFIGNAAITTIYTTASGSGGGLGCSPVGSGYVLVTHSLIASNTSSRHGGGINFSPASLLDNGLIANSIIRDNTASGAHYGGGVHMSRGVLRNCLVTGNVAGRGGGVYFSGASAGDKMLQNCTVAGNTTATHGGGVSILSGANPYMQNSIIWSNFSGSAGASNVSIEAASTAVSFSNCCTAGGTLVAAALVNQYSVNNISTDPGFIADYRLERGSSCVDAGVNQPWMREAGGVDLDGYSRIDRLTGIVDMGCYEFMYSGTFFWVR